MKGTFLQQSELVLFIHITRSFFTIGYLQTELLAPGHTVLTDIIMEGDIIMVVARVVTMTPSGIRVPRLEVMWWTNC